MNIKRVLSMLIIVFLFLLLINGCLTKTTIKSKEINSFVADMKKTYKQIKSCEEYSAANSLKMIYCTKDGITKEEAREILDKTREFISNKKLNDDIKEKNKVSYSHLRVVIISNKEYYDFTSIYKDDRETGKSVDDYTVWLFTGQEGKVIEQIDLNNKPQ